MPEIGLQLCRCWIRNSGLHSPRCPDSWYLVNTLLVQCLELQCLSCGRFIDLGTPSLVISPNISGHRTDCSIVIVWWSRAIWILENGSHQNVLRVALWHRNQGWGQIRICICKYKYKYKYSIFVFVFDQISSHVFVFDAPYMVYLTNTFSNTLFFWAVF